MLGIELQQLAAGGSRNLNRRPTVPDPLVNSYLFSGPVPRFPRLLSLWFGHTVCLAQIRHFYILLCRDKSLRVFQLKLVTLVHGQTALLLLVNDFS